MADSSQKFIGRNRAPRVQIEYEVELYGAQKMIQLAFVMGVLADLSGKSDVEKLSVDERKFLEIDIDTFNDRMKAIQPTVKFQVPNVLSGAQNPDEQLSVEVTFESMDDFSPDVIASKVKGLKELFEARKQLSNLLTYMDGKDDAKKLLSKAIQDKALLESLAAAAKPAEEPAAPPSADQTKA